MTTGSHSAPATCDLGNYYIYKPTWNGSYFDLAQNVSYVPAEYAYHTLLPDTTFLIRSNLSSFLNAQAYARWTQLKNSSGPTQGITGLGFVYGAVDRQFGLWNNASDVTYMFSGFSGSIVIPRAIRWQHEVIMTFDGFVTGQSGDSGTVNCTYLIREYGNLTNVLLSHTSARAVTLTGAPSNFFFSTLGNSAGYSDFRLRELYFVSPSFVTAGACRPIPTASSLLPSATAKPSHARIIANFRSQEKAQAFHEIMRAAS